MRTIHRCPGTLSARSSHLCPPPQSTPASPSLNSCPSACRVILVVSRNSASRATVARVVRKVASVRKAAPATATMRSIAVRASTIDEPLPEERSGVRCAPISASPQRRSDAQQFQSRGIERARLDVDPQQPTLPAEQDPPSPSSPMGTGDCPHLRRRRSGRSRRSPRRPRPPRSSPLLAARSSRRPTPARLPPADPPKGGRPRTTPPRG